MVRRTMKATILDTQTGNTATIDGPSTYDWVDGNWSCDCNRNPWGVDMGKPDGVCHGSERFLVVKAVFDDPDDYECTLEKLNADYPEELLSRLLT